MKKLLLLFTIIALVSAPLMFLSCEDFFFPETPNNSDDTEDETTIPDTPSALSVDSISSATLSPSIVLEWNDNSDDETGFTIERSTSTDFSSTESFSADEDDTEYLDKTIAEDTQYYYRIAAKNSAGSSDWINSAAITFAYDAPAAPSGLSATKTSTTSCNLSWTDNSYCEDGFTIEYSTDENFATFSSEPADADATSASLSGLTAEDYYYIRIFAYNETGDSDYAVTNIDLREILPDPPSGLSALQSTNTSCTVSWIDNSTNETGFKIDYGTDDTFTIKSTIETAADTESVEISGLTANTTYYFQVCAKNTAGDSAYTDPESVSLISEVPNTLNVVFKEDLDFVYPTDYTGARAYVIWIEADDDFYKSVFIGTKVFADRYTSSDSLQGVALPYWQFNKSDPDVDTVSGATDKTSDIVTESVNLSDLPAQFSVYFEIDHSWDSNSYFGDQPSILYRIDIDTGSGDTFFNSTLVGWTANEYTDDDLYDSTLYDTSPLNEVVDDDGAPQTLSTLIPNSSNNKISDSSVYFGVLQSTTEYITTATDLVSELYVTLTTE